MFRVDRSPRDIFRRFFVSPLSRGLRGSAAVSEAASAGSGKKLFLLAFGSLGVVYGDIGTSPLYTIRECFHGQHAIPPTEANILGVLSLVFWSMLFVVSIKYVLFILRADN
jgi:KUP system potassium uptake protein